ncbi:Uncharacterized protein BM_BM13037 [Brugia malayi]|uniref:Bm13037, isoform b n=1 Tax=Brugia malayi TaxID=6279 RepID=A0A0J9XP06_BRUMA|nr:Uncharacterized protein BM_BM13037 [Brugia malayi]CDP91994.1 Bm13037, isoform b [Brugia malayi]VIP00218.1 Uncharacterized protein BM_BM13037 [Brugia malayi]
MNPFFQFHTLKEKPISLNFKHHRLTLRKISIVCFRTTFASIGIHHEVNHLKQKNFGFI